MPKQGNRYRPPKHLRRNTKYGLSRGAIIFHISEGGPYYLLVKYPNYWGFVRGQVEPGETEEYTAFREALEEAGLTDLVFIQGFREVSSYFFKRDKDLIRKQDVYLLANTKSWNIKISHEHENIKWCTYDEALKLIKVKAIRNLLTSAHLFLNNLLQGQNFKEFL